MQVLQRGDALQKARLISGLILFIFVLAHFLNHAVGLIDLGLMVEVDRARQLVTRSVPGTIILLGALVTHLALTLYKLAMRTTLKMQAWEAAQIVLGLCIPFLLLPHIVNTRIAHTYFGVDDTYLYELVRLWPDSAIVQSTLLVLVWAHACVGIHYWLRLYSPYRALQPVLLFIAIAIPLAALAGFMVSGRTVADYVKAPEVMEEVKLRTHWPVAAINDKLADYRSLVRLSFVGVVALIGGAFLYGHMQRLIAPKVTIRYIGGPTIRATRGATLLEMSRAHGIPHASVCGGRARCSTCRVRIDDTQIPLPPPQLHEATTLASIQAPDNVRLACQIRPEAAMTVTRLLRPRTTGPEAVDLMEQDSGGVQKELAVLFLNVRDFSEATRRKLPYDSVFILNTIFAAAGDAITANGGHINQITGDGLFAVFGLTGGASAGCRQALRAARAIDLALDHVNAVLGSEISKPVAVAMALHCGPLLVGRVGYGESVDLTAIGPPMEQVRWLDGVAREQGQQIILSRLLADRADWDSHPHRCLTVVDPMTQEDTDVVCVGRGRDLPASILATVSA